jgi:signal transduction protein with GAF and PtsI domain
MARLPLRDIAERLANSSDLESCVDTLLAYLRPQQAEWHPTLALYDSTREIFHRVWQRERGRLDRRDLVLPVDHMPARFVRKFIRPSAFFNGADRRSLLAKLFQSSPSYEPDRFEGPQVQPLTAPVAWRSCICLPINDHDLMLGLLVIVSPQQRAFPNAVIEELGALRGMASLALARKLNVPSHAPAENRGATEAARRAALLMQGRVQELQQQAEALEQENHAKAATLENLMREVESLRRDADTRHDERAVSSSLTNALEEQAGAAAQHLNEAYAQLARTQSLNQELQDTVELVQRAFEALSGTDDAVALTRSLVAWCCQHFDVARCSVMRVDDAQGDLRIYAHRGLDPAMAGRVRVPMGSGVAGWVARNRQPVFMRERADATPVAPTGVDHYNSDSFISMPLVHRNRTVGVLNLSNKRDGEPFSERDLARARLAGSVLALALGEESQTPRAEAA